MGSVARNTGPRSRVIHTKIRSAKMNSAFTTTSLTTKSSTIEYSSSRSKRATSEVSDEFYQAMNTDMGRLSREFYTPEPISQTGNYYPGYKVTGNMETGSCHVSYLARPYYFYNVPSRYGFSKYVTVLVGMSLCLEFGRTLD